MSGRLSFRLSTLPRQASRGIRHTCAASSRTASLCQESPDVVRLKRRRARLAAFGHPAGRDGAPRACGSFLLCFLNRRRTDTQNTVNAGPGQPPLVSHACVPCFLCGLHGVSDGGKLVGLAFGEVEVGLLWGGRTRFSACVSEVRLSAEQEKCRRD